ncbi:MAG: glycosyltransferase family 4 protein [Candidatus Moranbacteria bacterium]|nr:glycosyltransferase family 4 protein [Candidatus Moranbacteria bacterium]
MIKDTEKKPRIIFISRAYPPVVGGIENQNYELSQSLPLHAEVYTIANTRGRKFLPLFAPYALIKALFLFRKYDAVLLGDGVLSIVGWFLKIFYKNKPVLSVVHGLDINYDSSSLDVYFEKLLVKAYQTLWVKVFIPKLDKLIAVGNTVIQVGLEAGIPEEKFIFVPNGVNPDTFIADYSRKDLERITNINLEGRKVILTLGRLAKRKGVAWFVANVMPKLDKNIFYFIAGDGVDKENIKRAILENNLENRVKMFSGVSDEDKKILYNTVDLFVQPNITVKGDMEGFGLVVLEAASCERVVLASELEGLKDAIVNGKNGFLAESKNAEQYAKKISALMLNDSIRAQFGKQAREYVKENLSWEKISKKYVEITKEIIKK